MNIKIDNQLARKFNSLLILSEIMKSPVSRTDLASKVNLTMGGLTPIVKNMISSKLIVEYKDTSTSTIGRKPTLLKVNEDRFYIITVSIDRNSYSISLVNFGNKILETKDIFYLNSIFNMDDLIKSISQNIDLIKEKFEISGISITSPGPLDYENGIILNPPNFNGWSDIPIKESLIKYGVPISLEHDVDAIAYAENYRGTAQAVDKFLNINIDQGVGCGIFINNHNFRKTNRNSCEIGHMSVDIFGEKCDCGNTGCLEGYININKILSRAALEKKQYINWIEVINLYKSRDAVILKIISDTVNILGNALVSLLNILDLNLIILSGPLAHLGNEIPEQLEKIISSKIIFKNKNIKVVSSTLKDSRTIGSSILFFEEFLNNNNLFN